MKKTVLLFLIALFSLVLTGCNQELPDYSVQEAFNLMNQSIENYLNADSISLDYTGSYTSTNYNNSEAMNVRMKNMGTENLIGKVKMDITENGTSLFSQVDFKDNVVYTSRTMDGSTEYVKSPLSADEYQTLYTSYLKKTCIYDHARYVQILIDKDTLTVNFEYHQNYVEQTFFVSNVLQSVSYATVTAVLTHDAQLISLSVAYDGNINSVVGHEAYQITILKMNQYIVISQLSSSQVALYQEVTTDES